MMKQKRGGWVRSARRMKLEQESRIWAVLGVICGIQTLGTAFGLLRLDTERLSSQMGEPFSTILLLVWMLLGAVVMALAGVTIRESRRCAREFRSLPRFVRLSRTVTPSLVKAEAA